MQQLESLIREAEAEAARQLQICNACRYCEGFCAVFPAMTRRLEFGLADVHYLANLCHNCGACLHACQYAPPHEFAVAFPQAMAKVRARTYEEYAWPAPFAAMYRRAALATALSIAGGLALMLVLAVVFGAPRVTQPTGDFYAVIPHNVMATIFGAVFLFALIALGIGVRRFWRDISPARENAPGASAEAVRDVAALKYLDGGHGDGCNNEDDRYSLARRRFHHFTFYGFLLCFAATCAGTFEHFFLGLHAPYPFLSVPVILGSLGGIGLLVGPIGQLALNLRRAPLQGDVAQRPMDRGFIALLLATSASGFALLFLRGTASMPVALATHLGVVMALFVTMPWGKFAHGPYRAAALLKHAIEKRLPNRLQLGSD